MYIINVTSDSIQEQTFTLFDMNLRLTIYYNKIACSWDIDLFNIDDNDYIVKRVGLSVLAPALIGLGLPFFITLADQSGNGLNPISKNDLAGRCQLVFISRDEYYEAIRTAIQT